MAEIIKSLNIKDTEYIIRPEFAQKLETYYQGDSTKTYGTNYPLYAQWYTNSRLKLNVDGYTTETDWAWKLANANGLLSVGSNKNPVYFSAGIPVACSSIQESMLTWGSGALAGSVSPLDAACSSVHSANRFQFAKPAGITIEYSTNGTSFSDYGASNDTKIALVSGIGTSLVVGKRSGKNVNTVNDKLRVTLNAANMGVYTKLQKLLINITTSYAKNCTVKIEKANIGSETTFSTIGTYNISGWSGWNSFYIGNAFGGSSTQTSQIASLRLTFNIGSLTSNQDNGLQLLDIVAIGDTYWTSPSDMAKTGHLYNWDTSKNATFPAKVTATSFSGALNASDINSGTLAAARLATSGVSAGTYGPASNVNGSNGMTMNVPEITVDTYGRVTGAVNRVYTSVDTKNTAGATDTSSKIFLIGATSQAANPQTYSDNEVYVTSGVLTAKTFDGVLGSTTLGLNSEAVDFNNYFNTTGLKFYAVSSNANVTNGPLGSTTSQRYSLLTFPISSSKQVQFTIDGNADTHVRIGDSSSGGTWSHLASTTYVQNAVNSGIAANDAMVFKGTLDGTSTSPGTSTPVADRGHTYRVKTAGYIGGVKCEVGDMLICTTDGTAAGTSANWTVIQTNIDGAVVGPASAVNNNIAVFNGTTGKLIKDSGFTIAKSVPSDAKFTDTNTSHAHSAGVGLVGSGNDGISNGTYSYKAKLRNETALTIDSIAATTTSGRVYPVAVDKSGYLSVNVPWTDTTYTFNGAISTVKDSNLTANRALISNGSGKIAVSATTSTELGYVNGVTSSIQTQLNDKLPLSGGTMTGTIKWDGNVHALNLRANHATYDGVITYQTAGNEAMLFTTKNPVTSFMFINGEDSMANSASDRWYSLTPGLQIKNNCVSIGKLIPNNTTPSYTLEVGGTTAFSNGHIYFTGSVANSSTSNTTQIVFGTPSEQHIAISANSQALILNPTTGSTNNQVILYLNSQSKFPSGLSVLATSAFTNIEPQTHNTYNLGSSSKGWNAIYSKTFTVDNKVTLQYNSTQDCLNFVFV